MMRQNVLAPMLMTVLLASARAGAADLPTGGQVMAGSATITTPSATQLDVNQTTSRAVVHWNGFDIGTGAGVRFNQPDSSAATLNVVDAATSSTLAGALSADGSVFLINPHGVTITPTGTVNTGGAFVASTLSISDNDFMNGQLDFSGEGGVVSNAGSIHASDAVLLGSRVDNAGDVIALTGRVALGSASVATLDLSGDGFLQVLAPATVTGEEALISNEGSLTADGGLVQLKAATLHSAVREAVNMPGTVRARSITGQDGAITFHGGDGGSLNISGTVDALPEAGADRGGSVELIGSTVELDFSNLAIGAEGSLTLGSNNINVSTNGDSYANTTGIAESPFGSSIGDLLRAGTDVTLHASNRIDWSGGLMIGEESLTPEAQGQAGDLHLKAGGSISMGGTFSTLNGDWTLTANATPLVDAERPDGMASISMNDYFSSASFVNNNGHLTLEILDGGGDPDRAADSIRLPYSYAGPHLSARIDPGVAGYDYAEILLQNDIDFGSTISLDGHLRVYTEGSEGGGGGGTPLTLSGSQVDWVTETTGGRLTGGLLRFIEDGVVTRFGRGAYGPTSPGADAMRLNLGGALEFSRVYGDADPDQLALGDLVLSLAAHNGVAPGDNAVDQFGNLLAGVSEDGIPLSELLADGSLTISGPGSNADVGDYALHLDATGNLAFKQLVTEQVEVDDGAGGTWCCETAYVSGAAGAYWIDLSGNVTGNDVPLNITPRPLTASILDPSYDYGSPEAAVSLDGIVNGDEILPTGMLDGQSLTYDPVSGGYGFDPYLDAGEHAYSVNGITGNRAANYVLDASGLPDGVVSIAPRLLNYHLLDGEQTYGSLQAPTVLLDDVLALDAVDGIVGLYDDGGTVAFDARTPAGTYSSLLTALSGADAGNYALADSGNIDGAFTVLRKALTWSVADASSVYGSLATLGATSVDGVLEGDDVTGLATIDVELAPDTDAGEYAQSVTSLDGTDSGNYILAEAGNTPGTLTIQPKLLSWTGSSVSVVYGDGDWTLPMPSLDGVVGEDDVALDWGFARVECVGGCYSYQPFSDYAVETYEVNVDAARLASNSAGGLQGADHGNYLLDPVAGGTPNTVTVTPRPLTYTLGDDTSVYGTRATPALTLNGVVAGADEISAEFRLTRDGIFVALENRTPVGDYDVDVTGLSGYGSGNYVLADSGNTPGTLLIEPKVLNWHLGSDSNVYGDTLTGSASSLAGLLNGDDVVPLLAALEDGVQVLRPDVGTYDDVVIGLAGSDVSNYQLAESGNSGGTLTITPRPLTWHITDTASTYGSLATTGSVTLENLVEGDAIPEATLGVFGSGGGAVTLTERTDAGLYLARVIGLSDPNYGLAEADNTDGNILIDPKALRFTTFDASSTYGTVAELALASLESGDILEGDDVGVTDTMLQGIGSPIPEQDAGTYTQVPEGLTGADGGNYQLSLDGSTLGTLTINPKEITYQLTLYREYEENGTWRSQYISDRGYLYGELTGGGNLVTDDQIQGVLEGDMVWLGVERPFVPVSTGGYLGAGTYQWTGTGLNGADAGNYVLASGGHQDASLTIVPRGIWLDTNLQDQTYGQISNDWLDLSLENVMSGDDVHPGQLYVTKRYVSSPDIPLEGTGYAASLPRDLVATDYRITGGDTAVMGADVGNYAFSLGTHTFTVDPMPVTARMMPGSNEFEYGKVVDLSSLIWLETTPFPDDDMSLRVGVPEGYADGSDRNDAGTYSGFSALSLSGYDAFNYTLVNPGILDGVVTVVPKPLFLYLDDETLVQRYGDRTDLPVLEGVLAGDEELVHPLGMVTHRSSAETQSADNIIDVGLYDYWVYLDGPAAGNYTLPDRDLGILQIRPRTLLYRVEDAVIQYGNFLFCGDPTTCNGGRSGRYGDDYLWVPTDELGEVHLEGLVPGGKAVDARTELIDLNGERGSLEDVPPPGSYLEVVTGLTGPGSHNYELAESGNLPGVLTVTPQWVRWATYDALYMPETGFLVDRADGLSDDITPHLTHPTRNGDLEAMLQLTNSYGEPMSWDQVEPGTYNLEVAGLVGDKAHYYRLVPDGATGTLTLFEDSSLGMDSIGGDGPVPQPPVVAPPETSTDDAMQDEWETPESGDECGFGECLSFHFESESEDGSTETGAGVGTEIGQEAETGTDVGGGRLTLRAESYEKALAKVGVTGVTLKAEAGQQVSINFQSGPGFVEAGLYAQQAAELKAGLEGLKGKAEFEAGGYVDGGVAGDLGGGAEGTITASTGYFTKAEAEGGIAYEDGKIKTSYGTEAGVGVSAGFESGVSGETGGVNGGATVYSPGQVAQKMSVGGGYQDGRISVDFDFGVALGFGGVDFSLGFEINVEQVGSTIEDAAKSVGCGTGMGGCSRGPSPGDYARKAMTKLDDPVGRFRYLAENPDWAAIGPKIQKGESLSPETIEAYNSNKAFFESYQKVAANTQSYLDQQKAMHEGFMTALQEDPQAAIAYAEDVASVKWDTKKIGMGITPEDMANLGVKLTVQNGVAQFSNL